MLDTRSSSISSFGVAAGSSPRSARTARRAVSLASVSCSQREVPAEPARRPLDEVAGAHGGGPIVGRTSGGSAAAGASTMLWDV